MYISKYIRCGLRKITKSLVETVNKDMRYESRLKYCEKQLYLNPKEAQKFRPHIMIETELEKMVLPQFFAFQMRINLDVRISRYDNVQATEKPVHNKNCSKDCVITKRGKVNEVLSFHSEMKYNKSKS